MDLEWLDKDRDVREMSSEALSNTGTLMAHESYRLSCRYNARGKKPYERTLGSA